MVSEARRAEIRRFYRRARLEVEKTQIQVESSARLFEGRYWKIENGFLFPNAEERKRLARVLSVNEADLPSEHQVAKAS